MALFTIIGKSTTEMEYYMGNVSCRRYTILDNKLTDMFKPYLIFIENMGVVTFYIKTLKK